MPEANRLYEVVNVASNLYLDNGHPVSGYRILARIVPFNETIAFDVPDIKSGTVHNVIMGHIEDRMKLDKLGIVEDDSK